MTVNEMIIEAITTDSRKRKARHQDELKSLGYDIIKDGSWFIRYTKTGRFIDMDYSQTRLWSTNGYIKFGRVYSRKTKRYSYKPLSSIDFEGFLTINRDNNSYSYVVHETKVSAMSRNLNDRKYHKKALDGAMNDLQNKIDAITKEYTDKLKRAENSYKYSIEYHTKALDTANKNIQKLLKKDIDN